jgi:hypothetical protein
MRDAAGRAAAAVLVLCAAMLSGCGKDPFGSPPRVKTHGFRAHAAMKKGAEKSEFEIAVRGENRRKEPAAGAQGHVFIWLGGEKRALELDPVSRSYWERPFTSIDEILPGHPLEAGFSDKAEAARRGTEEYHRESDTVFSGHVCWIWRFDDKYNDATLPSTSYWTAPSLDGLVLRRVREVMKPEGPEVLESSELTNVRLIADPLLFTTQDFKKVDPPR